MTKITTEDFIARAKAAHGEKYIYDESDYSGSNRHVLIFCRDHGHFHQVAAEHLRGKGCPKCAGKGMHTLSSIVSAAKSVHGERYDYRDSRYNSKTRKMSVRCPRHGEFEIDRFRHTSGAGCARCYYDYSAKKRTMKTHEFVRKAKSVHGNRYDYSESVCLGSKVKLKIRCKDHGHFFQIPNSHLAGQGCPLCPKRFSDPCYIYILKSDGASKIGVSIIPERRIYQLRMDSPFGIALHKKFRLENYSVACQKEKIIHKQIEHLNCGYKGFDGCTEWFNVTAERAESIVKYFIESHND